MIVLRLSNKKGLRTDLLNRYKNNMFIGIIVVDVRDGIWSITNDLNVKTNPIKKYIPFNLTVEKYYHKQNKYAKYYLSKSDSIDTRISAIMQCIDKEVFNLTRLLPDINIKNNTGVVTQLRGKTKLRDVLSLGVTTIYIDVKRGVWYTIESDHNNLVKISDVDITTNREYWYSDCTNANYYRKNTTNMNNRITAVIQEIEIAYFELQFIDGRKASRKITHKKLDAYNNLLIER